MADTPDREEPELAPGQAAHVDEHARQHERGDVSVRQIVRFSIGLGLVLVAVHLGLWWMFVAFKRQAIANDPPPPPLAGQRQTPPGPKLQVNPRRDMRELREAEARLLNSHELSKTDPGKARIPIDRAMQLIAEQGLPQWDPPPEQSSAAGEEEAGSTSEGDGPENNTERPSRAVEDLDQPESQDDPEPSEIGAEEGDDG